MLSFLMLLAGMMVVGLLVSLSRLPRSIKLLVYAALLLRVVGTLGRHFMVMVVYGGRGDSLMYFRYGNQYAEHYWNLNFSPLWDSTYWDRKQWWGTQFVRNISGVVVSVTGDSLLAAYLAFSLLAFVGLLGFGMAFRRSYPDVPIANYLRWIWLFPSLWFWPSAIGKEAVLLMGLGLALWGFVGRNERVNWILLAVGVFFVFAVRAQVAAVLILSLVLAQWLSLGGRWTLGKTVQGLLILAVGLGGISLAMQSLGIDSFDTDGVQTYLEDNTGRGITKDGSTVAAAQVGLAGVPMALVNIWFRPFPWEARNPQLLITAMEIMAFWGIAWFRRRQLVAALRHWRSDRLLRVAIPFILTYSITLGMLMSNMGIIARQRIFLFPFLFLLVEAVPRAALQRQRAPQSAARPGPGWVPRRAVPAGARR